MASPHSATLNEPQDRLRKLPTAEGTSWLARHQEGRLGYLSGRGPQRVVVRYALAGDQILFLLPDYNEAVRYAPGEQVSLIVDGQSAGEDGYDQVWVQGTAQLASATGQPVLAELDDQWPDDLSRKMIRLPITELTGCLREPSGTGSLT